MHVADVDAWIGSIVGLCILPELGDITDTSFAKNVGIEFDSADG